MKLSLNQQAEHNYLAVKITSHLIQFLRVGRDAQINKPSGEQNLTCTFNYVMSSFCLWWAKLWCWFILARTPVIRWSLHKSPTAVSKIDAFSQGICVYVHKPSGCLQTCLKQVFCFYVKCAGKGNRN